MGIQNLRVDRKASPIGVDRRAPHFSFESDRGEGLFEVSLFAGQSKIAEQERLVGTSESRSFTFARALSAGTLYRWQVSDGKNCANARFETAEDFTFSYITPASPTKTLPVLERCFEAPMELCSSRLYIAASCAHAIKLNGERVGAGADIKGMYYTYDLFPYLWRGDENRMQVYLAESKHPILAAGISMLTETGVRRVIATDSAWQTMESGIFWNPYSNHEAYRSPERMMGKSIRTVRVQEEACERRPLSARHERSKLLRPVGIDACESGWLLDMGRRIRGYARLRLRGARGREARLQFLLSPIPDGTADCYAVHGSERKECYEPLFSRYQFRYIYVTGLQRHEVEELEIVSLSVT